MTNVQAQDLQTQPKPRLSRIIHYKWLYLIAAGIVVFDQATKTWIHTNLAFGTYHPSDPGRITVIPDFFHIVHLGNTGAAWGIFQGMSQWLALLGILAVVVIYFCRHHFGLNKLPVQISFGLLCGGIIGNVVDRFIHGYVIDFLDFRFGDYAWPAFNIADAGIVTGVILYMITSFFEKEE
ncbi:MAG: signal peptidase II [Opitutales bacterium]